MKIWTVYDLFNEEIVGSYTNDVAANAEARNIMQEIVENEEPFEHEFVSSDTTFIDGRINTLTYSYTHPAGDTVAYMYIEANTLH